MDKGSLISIVGNGAIGNLLALRCHQQGMRFQLLTRDGAPINLLAEDFDGKQIRFSPQVVDTEQPITPGIIILPLKAYQVLPALEQLSPQLTPEHTVILLHNGMGTLQGARRMLPQIPLIAATTSYGALKPANNFVKATGKGHTHAGWVYQPNNLYTEDYQKLLDTLLPPCNWHQDLERPLWDKLAINAVINPLTAINGVRNGALVGQEYTQQIVSLCQETAAVMTACGYPTTTTELQQSCYQVIKATANNFSSMHQDVKHHRRTEIDFISGFLVQQGNRFNLSVTHHHAMLNKIKAMECL